MPFSFTYDGHSSRELLPQWKRKSSVDANARTTSWTDPKTGLSVIATANVPRVPPERRLKITDLGDNFYTIVAEYGFMQYPNVPRVLHRCAGDGIKFNLMDTSFFVGRVSIVPDAHSRMSAIRCRVFELMHRNALPATEFFRIPPNRVIELGAQVEL